MPRILALTANPFELENLRLDAEIREIRLRLGSAPNFRFDHEGAARAQDLLRLLETIRPDILHFSGHGSDSRREPAIALEDAKGKLAPVTAPTLRRVFGILSNPPKCVFLNSCYSDMQARAIGDVVPVVLGAKGLLEDDLARAFSGSFYEWLGAGKTVQEAFELAKTQATLDSGRPSSFVIQSKKGVAPKLCFYGRPEIVAEFKTSRAGVPVRRKSGNEEFEIFLWIRGAEDYAESVVYEACDESFPEPFWEVRRSQDPNFKTYDFVSYGQVTLRAQVWTKDGGIGVTSTLTDALARFYGPQPSTPIRKAIKELSEY